MPRTPRTSPTAAAARPAARGRPRDAAVDARILTAVVDEIAAAGIGGFSVNSVAARAGVAKRSIYSRWAQRDELILAGLATLSARLEPPRRDDLEADLRGLYDQIAAVFNGSRWPVMFRCLLELNDHPQLFAAAKRAYYDPCMAAITETLAEARERGELRDSVDLVAVAEMFTSSVVGLGQMMSGGGRHDAASRDRLIDALVRGVGRPVGQPPSG